MTRIEQKDNGKKGRFVLYYDEAVAGEMTYVWVDDSKIIPLCPFAARVFAKDPDIQDVKF